MFLLYDIISICTFIYCITFLKIVSVGLLRRIFVVLILFLPKMVVFLWFKSYIFEENCWYLFHWLNCLRDPNFILQIAHDMGIYFHGSDNFIFNKIPTYIQNDSTKLKRYMHRNIIIFLYCLLDKTSLKSPSRSSSKSY